MTPLLKEKIENLKGVGGYYVERLNKLGIQTVQDLLWHFPIRYEDFSNYVFISDIKTPGVYSVLGRVEKIKMRRAFRKRMFITEATLYDKTGTIPVIWFGQSYLTRNIPQGALIVVSGKVSRHEGILGFQNPSYEVIGRKGKIGKFLLDRSSLKHTGGLIPVYPETRGLTSRGLRFLIKPLISRVEHIQDYIPSEVLRRVQIPALKYALKQIHFPDSFEESELAKKRFAFEELFLLQLLLLQARKKNTKLSALPITPNIDLIKKFLRTLPFTLTRSQKKALWEILRDLAKPYPMNRLLNGDVGSGKTIVAFAAALEVVRQGYQVAVLVPTEILARQHFEKAVQLFRSFDLPIALLVSKETQISTDGLSGEVSRSQLKDQLLSGKPFFVIGTHAIIQKGVQFSNLALAIVDEQHRFGVAQRKALLHGHTQVDLQKNTGIVKEGPPKNQFESETEKVPHLLSMTATPIPRSLALTLWGDLDISVITELPSGRKKVITKIIPAQKRRSLYSFIRKEVNVGNLVFIVCPRIETQEEMLTPNEYLRRDTKAVKQEYERLSKEVFFDLRLGLLHGKMKPLEKERVMNDFANKKIQILVSTSVIEVGIDIPEATVIVIEGADHFGLAQLHQFRGRVGRSDKQSYCFLLTESETKTSQKRLETFAKTFDGFSLAEQDLKMRGPGEFLGTKQSGMPDLAMNSLKDLSLVLLARKEAEDILNKSPDLNSYPLLKQRLKEFKYEIHLE